MSARGHVIDGVKALVALAGVLVLLQGSGASRGEERAWPWAGEPFRYVLMRTASESSAGAARAEDFRAAAALGRDTGAPLLYARLDGRRWVIRDPARLADAMRLTESLDALGRRQSALGARHGEIGRAQAQVGERQSHVGALQAGAGRRLADLARVMAERRRQGLPTAEQEQDRGGLRAELRRLAAIQDRLRASQRDLDERQRPLAEAQERLGEAQAEHSSRLHEDMRALVREAIRSGQATTVE